MSSKFSILFSFESNTRLMVENSWIIEELRNSFSRRYWRMIWEISKNFGINFWVNSEKIEVKMKDEGTNINSGGFTPSSSKKKKTAAKILRF